MLCGGRKRPPKCQSGGKKRPRNSDTTKSGMKGSYKVGAESAPKIAKWGQKAPPKVAKWGQKTPPLS